MVQNPSTNNDQPKHIPEKFLAGQRMYGTEERGMVLILPGELPPARFGDNPGVHHFCILDMENNVTRDGITITAETQQKMAMELEKTKPFINGRVKYVKSPDELRMEERKKEQEKFMGELKESLSEGILELNLEEKSMEQLCHLAEKIGAVYLNKNGKVTLKNVIVKNIKELLGLKEPEPVDEPEIATTKSKKEV